MAHRELKKDDHVRIVDKGVFHGYNAVVEKADGISCRVRIDSRKKGERVFVWQLSKDLIIRHCEYSSIFDGQYDEVAAARKKHLDEIFHQNQIDDDDDQMFLDMDMEYTKALYFKCERLEEENERLKQVIKTLQGVA